MQCYVMLKMKYRHKHAIQTEEYPI